MLKLFTKMVKQKNSTVTLHFQKFLLILDLILFVFLQYFARLATPTAPRPPQITQPSLSSHIAAPYAAQDFPVVATHNHLSCSLRNSYTLRLPSLSINHPPKIFCQQSAAVRRYLSPTLRGVQPLQTIAKKALPPSFRSSAQSAAARCSASANNCQEGLAALPLIECSICLDTVVYRKAAVRSRVPTR